MRRQLKKFLPIMMVALLVQIFAPIAACWAANLAASDPLAAASICRGEINGAAGQGDQTGHHAHDGCCSACSVLQTGAPVDHPQTVAEAVERMPYQVAWHDFASELNYSRAGSPTQARGPPLFS